MCESCFTEKDFDLLMDYLKPFDDTFPHLQEHFDRLFYYLVESMPEISDCETYESFDEFRQIALEARANRKIIPERDLHKLALLLISVSEVIRNIPARFPHLVIPSLRVLFEMANVVMPSKATFDEYLAESKSLAAVNSNVKGVG